MKSYAFIVNAASGRGGAIHRARALQRFLADAASVDFLETTHRGSAIDLARGVVGQVDRVIAVGGDGTLNEVLNGLMASGKRGSDLPELGFLKAGTGNAVLKTFGLVSRPRSVARALATAESRPLDVGLARVNGDERAFLLWFGAGWDGLVIHVLNADRLGKMGLLRMIAHMPRILKSMMGYAQPPITARVDGQIFGPHANVIAANVGNIAFGGVVADAADPGDGQLDVVGVPRASLWGLIRLGFFMVTSGLTRSKKVNHRLGNHIELESDGDVPFQIDGEPLGKLPASMTILPGAVRFLMTTRSKSR